MLKYVEAILKPITALAEALHTKPEAALGGMAILAPALLVALGVNHFVAILGPLAVYVLYCVRAGFIAVMDQRRAETRLAKTQADGERRIRELAEKYLYKLEARSETRDEEGTER